MNKFILGTANFGNNYRNVCIPEKECFEILGEYEKRGGTLVDTALDYGNSVEIINNYIIKNNSKLKMMIKTNEYFEALYKYNNIHAVLSRSNKLFYTKYIHGQSIYYPHEINPGAQIVIIPDSILFFDYVPVIKLHSELYVRSHYKIKGLKLSDSAYAEMIDGYIIGVENKKQLIENMELKNV